MIVLIGNLHFQELEFAKSALNVDTYASIWLAAVHAVNQFIVKSVLCLAAAGPEQVPISFDSHVLGDSADCDECHVVTIFSSKGSNTQTSSVTGFRLRV